MAKLLITSNGFQNQELRLNLGTNKVGRSPGNDFQIEHATISARHCELVLGDGELTVRDCGSTNGTFIDGRQVEEAELIPGQKLRLGDVELLVADVEVRIVVPKIEVSRPAPPIVRSDGSMICPRHRDARVTHQCTVCREVMCDECVHRLRRRGGKLWKLCPLCSNKVELIGGEKKKKKSFFGLLQKTVKLPFLRNSKREEL